MAEVFEGQAIDSVAGPNAVLIEGELNYLAGLIWARVANRIPTITVANKDIAVADLKSRLLAALATWRDTDIPVLTGITVDPRL